MRVHATQQLQSHGLCRSCAHVGLVLFLCGNIVVGALTPDPLPPFTLLGISVYKQTTNCLRSKENKRVESVLLMMFTAEHKRQKRSVIRL